jgi:hypothetical protein
MKVFAATLIVVAAVGAAIGLLMVRHAGMKVGGNVTVEKTSIGSFSFAVNDCASGAAFVPGFFGADLRARDGFALRVVDSGDNARLWFFSQGGKQGSVAVGKQHCSQWDVFVDWAHMKVNRVNTVSGHVRVTCAPLGGGTVKADVNFERCAM